MILFSKKIKCLNCGKNFKSKKERSGRRIYLCSSYDNGIGNCKREVLLEGEILWLLDRRFKRRLSEKEIKESVKLIEVENKNKFTIFLKNDEPIILGDNYIQF